jgi:hypothetical protein
LIPASVVDASANSRILRHCRAGKPESRGTARPRGLAQRISPSSNSRSLSCVRQVETESSDGLLDLGDIPRIFQKLDEMIAHFRRIDDQHRAKHYTFTQRLFDKARPAGERTYIQAFRAIETAWENYSAIFGLLQGHGATVFAPHNLIRPAFEAAFYALWALDPEDGRDRCMRGLRLAIEDNRQHRNWTDELVKIPGLTDAQREQMRAPIANASTVYREEAAKLGANWNVVSQKPNVEEAIPKLRPVVELSDPVIPHTLVAAWRQLSGYQHGHMYAAVAGANLSVKLEIPGGVIAWMTIDDEQFGLAMQHAALMQMWAVHAYIGRTITQAP